MINTEMHMLIYEDSSGPKLYRLEKAFQAVPRKGESIEITNGGWVEIVRDIYWLWSAPFVMIEFRALYREAAAEYFKNSTKVAYMDEDDYESLIAAGWEER